MKNRNKSVGREEGMLSKISRKREENEQATRHWSYDSREIPELSRSCDFLERNPAAPQKLHRCVKSLTVLKPSTSHHLRYSCNLKNKATVWQLHRGNSLPPAAGLLGHLSPTHSPTNTPSAPRNQPECHLRLSQGGFVEVSFLEDQVLD